MAFYPIDRNANSAQNVLNGKSSLVASLNTFLQIQRESAEMTEVQVQSHYGLPWRHMARMERQGDLTITQ